MYNSLYGNFRQLTFTQVWDQVEDFLADYEGIGIAPTISPESATTLFYLLYAQYGNSTVAASDINRFKYQLFSIVFAYGPTWEARIKLQANLRELLDNPTDLFAGTTQINNQAYHPGQAPSTQTTEELEAINSQFVTKYRKDKMTGYATLNDLLDTDVTMDFIKKFSRLFIIFVQPEKPLWYVSELDEEDITNG